MWDENNERAHLLLVGGGEFAKAVIAALADSPWRVAGILDNTPFLKEVGGVPVLGPENRAVVLRHDFSHALVTVGASAGARVRKYLFQQLKNCGYSLPAFISPLAHISNNAHVGEGSIVMPHAVIGENVQIGANCVIDANATMLANASLGENSWLGANAALNMGAHAGNGVGIGNGASIAANVTLGKRCSIDAGASVEGDIAPYKIVHARHVG